MNEFEDFRNRMLSNGGRDARQLKEIDALFYEMVNIKGAVDEMIRSEGEFSAIPSHKHKYLFWESIEPSHFGLRLYCILVNSETVIVLNGCSKTMQNPLECPNCKEVYKFCKAFSECFFYEWRIANNIGVEDSVIFNAANEDDDEIDSLPIILNIKYEEN